jgi:hypothetical protein
MLPRVAKATRLQAIQYSNVRADDALVCSAAGVSGANAPNTVV